MIKNNTNVAYDLANFAPYVKSARPDVKVVKTKASRKKAIRALKIKLSIAAAVLVALMCFTVYNKVVLTETVSKANLASQQLSQLKNENSRLEIKLEGIVSLKQADEYATNVLGLVKKENGQVIYVSLYTGSQISEYDQPLTIYSFLSSGLGFVVDYFG